MCLPLDCYDDDDNDHEDDDGAGGDGSNGGDDEDHKDNDDDNDEEEEIDDERIPTQSPMLLPAARELICRWATSPLLGDDDDDDSGGRSRGGMEVCRARVLGDHCRHDDVDANIGSDSSEGQAFAGEKERAPPSADDRR